MKDRNMCVVFNLVWTGRTAFGFKEAASVPQPKVMLGSLC